MDYGFKDLSGRYQWGQQVEAVLGPFYDSYVVVCVREMGAIGMKFAASYKVCADPARPGVDAEPERFVAGLADSVQEAMDIAEQLARLYLAGRPLVRQAARRARDAGMKHGVEELSAIRAGVQGVTTKHGNPALAV